MIKVLKVVLDACVIYPASVRDVLLSVASEGVYTPYWSQLIHNEWQRNLLKNRNDLSQDQLSKTASIMDTRFHGSCVNSFHHLIDQLNLPDVNDCHVLALAIETKSKFIITSNIGDFPKSELDKYGIAAITPDDFLTNLYKKFDVLVIEAMRRQRARLKNPSKTAEEFLDKLSAVGLSLLASELENKKSKI